MNEYHVVDLDPQPTAVMRATVPMAELTTFFGRAFSAVWSLLTAQGVAVAGAPFGLYLSEPTDTVELEAGFPVAGPFTPSDEVISSVLPGGRAAATMHVGPYDSMEKTYGALLAWITGRGMTPGTTMWEVYLTDPQKEPDPAKWQTMIYWPTV
jgi:effector-binding domain-containing protein